MFYDVSTIGWIFRRQSTRHISWILLSVPDRESIVHDITHTHMH